MSVCETHSLRAVEKLQRKTVDFLHRLRVDYELENELSSFCKSIQVQRRSIGKREKWKRGWTKARLVYFRKYFFRSHALKIHWKIENKALEKENVETKIKSNCRDGKSRQNESNKVRHIAIDLSLINRIVGHQKLSLTTTSEKKMSSLSSIPTRLAWQFASLQAIILMFDDFVRFSSSLVFLRGWCRLCCLLCLPDILTFAVPSYLIDYFECVDMRKPKTCAVFRSFCTFESRNQSSYRQT